MERYETGAKPRPRQHSHTAGHSKLELPGPVSTALSLLHSGGKEAYVVGGCVRDSLLGRNPQDWDVTTSAFPEQTRALFASAGFRVLETGMRHGTVTAFVEGTPIEITTYRVDGAYTDHRRPDEVRFTPRLREDLGRRDFTINAMAYCPGEGLVDCFGGAEDCRRGVVRCVGDPDRRFQEDALRVMRALRFASVLGFRVEQRTGEAALRNKELLRAIAPERIAKEWTGVLCGRAAAEVLRDYVPVAEAFFPELPALAQFHRDLFEHTLRGLQLADPLPVLRLAMLFLDMGKLSGVGPGGDSTGYASLSAETAARTLAHLRLDNATRNRVELLVRYHNIAIEPNGESVKRWLGRIGEEAFSQLLQVQAAESTARLPTSEERLRRLQSLKEIKDRVIRDGECYQVRDLAVDGGDLIRAGMIPGKELGRMLDYLLQEVIKGRLPNQKRALLDEAQKRSRIHVEQPTI